MYSPYSALASNQQSYVARGSNNYRQPNYDYYDYNDYGSSNNQQLRQRQLALQRQQQGQVAVNRRAGTNMKAAASGGYGSYSGDYCDNGISIGLLLTAALGIAVMFYTLYTKITMAGGRRRRKRANEPQELLDDAEEQFNPFKFSVDHFTDFLYSGNFLISGFFYRPSGFYYRPSGFL